MYYYQCRIYVRVPTFCGLWHKKEVFDSMLIFTTEAEAHNHGAIDYKLFLFLKGLEEYKCKLLDVRVNYLIVAEK